MKAKMSKAPLVSEGKPQHAHAPVKKPPVQPHVAEAQGPGRKSTFKAPRSDSGGGDATTRGYVKVG